MDVYLPIANMSVNGLLLVALGALTGILSGLFGVGGGTVIVPLLVLLLGFDQRFAAGTQLWQCRFPCRGPARLRIP